MLLIHVIIQFSINILSFLLDKNQCDLIVFSPNHLHIDATTMAQRKESAYTRGLPQSPASGGGFPRGLPQSPFTRGLPQSPAHTPRVRREASVAGPPPSLLSGTHASALADDRKWLSSAGSFDVESRLVNNSVNVTLHSSRHFAKWV